MGNSRKGDWMQTVNGHKFWPLDPRPEDIHIEDIAHALSLLCRFGGHCTKYYSVAQHSMLVSFHCPKEYQLWGLLHDASEAYIGDMIRPLKRDMPEYHLIETKVMTAIAQRFNLTPLTLPVEVKKVDTDLLFTEKRDLMRHTLDWFRPPGVEELDIIIEPMLPNEAYWHFMNRYKELV